MAEKQYQQREELKHFGVLGMRWGRRKSREQVAKETGRKGIIDAANKILNNPKSSQKSVDKALESIGVDPKTGRPMRATKPVYDKDGNDISVKPFKRIGKEKGQSDKDFDKMVEEEMNPKPEKMVGKPVKTLFGTRTEAVYDKDGNDISSKPFGRPFKKKGQSDKDYDKEIADEEARDPDANPTPANLARRKVEDLQMDRETKIHMGVTLAVAGAATVAMLVAKKQLGDSAKAAILKKYGPELAKMIIKSKGL